MKNMINVLALALLIIWTIGFFVFDAEKIIHLLLFIALAGLFYDIVDKNRKRKKKNNYK